jgi:hypothetical protein
MVQVLRALAAAGGQLQKRDGTTPWSTVSSTYISDASEYIPVTLLGYYYTTQAVSAGSIVPSTATVTT